MYDLSKEELTILESLGQGKREQDIAQTLGLSISEYRKRWQSLATKFDWHEPQTVEGKTLALTFERSRNAALVANLHVAQTRLRALMDLSPNGVLVVDGRTGRINQANETCSILFGYAVDELVDMEVERLLDSGLSQKHVNLRLGFLQSIRKREVGYHPPIFAIRKNGSRVELVIGLTSSATTDEVMVICSEYASVMDRERVVS